MYAEEKVKCCFCGKEILFMQSHDARPIKTNFNNLLGDRCCWDCNSNIVIPTRLFVWGTEDVLRLELQSLKDKLMEYDIALSNQSPTAPKLYAELINKIK